jgi:UDP-N-acetylglucosamine 4,6-dehydratase (inverting)
MSFFKNKTLLVTGGTGSFGKLFVKTILTRFQAKKIIIYSRDEFKQSEMSREFLSFKKKLRFFIGDVRDLARLQLAITNVDYVVHAAALKQVPTAEYNPFEVIKTNILGTQNVIESIANSKVKKAIALSTDKAAAPVNLYGATKLAADKLFIAANNFLPNKIFSVVRYGNVMMSRGSVIPELIRQKKLKYLNITDKRMTRFSITLEDGVNFVIKSLICSMGGELFVPKIPSYKILDVAKAVGPECKINYIGIRPGEKLHEELITSSDSFNTLDLGRYYIVLPSFNPRWTLKKLIKNNNIKKINFCKEGFSYNSESNNHFLNIDEIRRFISKSN